MSRAPQDTPVTFAEVQRQCRLRPHLHTLRAWTEQRGTWKDLHTFNSKPASERAEQRPPLPDEWPGVDTWATIIRLWIDEAEKAWESGNVDKGDLAYVRASQAATILEGKLRGYRPRSSRGRPRGSHGHPTLEMMTQELRALLQHHTSPRKQDFMKKLGRGRDHERRVNEWLKPHGLTYTDFVRLVKHPS